MCYRVAYALHGMGLIPRRIQQRSYTCIAAAEIDPEWVAWCTRWRETTTLAPASARSVYYAILKAGRWLAREHPTVREPDGWTREIARAYVSAGNDCNWASSSHPMRTKDGIEGHHSLHAQRSCSSARLARSSGIARSGNGAAATLTRCE